MFLLPEVDNVKTINFGMRGKYYLGTSYDVMTGKKKSDNEVEIDKSYKPVENELIKFQKEIDSELVEMRRRIRDSIKSNSMDTEFETQMYRNVSSHANIKLSIIKERKNVVKEKLDFKNKFDKLTGSGGTSSVENGDETPLGTTYNAPVVDFMQFSGVQHNTPGNVPMNASVNNIQQPPIISGPVANDDVEIDFAPDPLNNINYGLATANVAARERDINVTLHYVKRTGKFWLTYEENGSEVIGISKKRIDAMRPLAVNPETMTAIDGSGKSYMVVYDEENNMPDEYKSQWVGINV